MTVLPKSILEETQPRRYLDFRTSDPKLKVKATQCRRWNTDTPVIQMHALHTGCFLRLFLHTRTSLALPSDRLPFRSLLFGKGSNTLQSPGSLIPIFPGRSILYVFLHLESASPTKIQEHWRQIYFHSQCLDQYLNISENGLSNISVK